MELSHAKSLNTISYHILGQINVSMDQNKFTCTGFLFCPRKPHLKGREYHKIYCGESVIIQGWKIVKGRDHPIPIKRPEFETSSNMKTDGPIIWLNRYQWTTGN